MSAFSSETVAQANHPDLECHHCLIRVARLLCSSDDRGAKDAFWSLIQYTPFVFHSSEMHMIMMMRHCKSSQQPLPHEV